MATRFARRATTAVALPCHWTDAGAVLALVLIVRAALLPASQLPVDAGDAGLGRGVTAFSLIAAGVAAGRAVLAALRRRGIELMCRATLIHGRAGVGAGAADGIGTRAAFAVSAIAVVAAGLVHGWIATVLFAEDAGIDASVAALALATFVATGAGIRVAGLAVRAADVTAFPLIWAALAVDAGFTDGATLAECTVKLAVHRDRPARLTPYGTAAILLRADGATATTVVGSSKRIAADIIDRATFVRDEADTQFITPTANITAQEIGVISGTFAIIATLTVSTLAPLLDRIGFADPVVADLTGGAVTLGRAATRCASCLAFPTTTDVRATTTRFAHMRSRITPLTVGTVSIVFNAPAAPANAALSVADQTFGLRVRDTAPGATAGARFTD
ncbi:MAG TPA: hypothetical protein VFL82_02960 [Thermomicrobiales bacterium]|nr:hypothetical protein [Thermomicrobiales bacterium]